MWILGLKGLMSLKHLNKFYNKQILKEQIVINPFFKVTLTVLSKNM